MQVFFLTLRIRSLTEGDANKTSVAGTTFRSDLLLGKSFCAKVARSPLAKQDLMNGCSSVGKNSKMRLKNCTVSVVCNVAYTRCPVSAAIKPANTVSLSRISHNHDHVGILSYGTSECRRKVEHIDPNFPLANDAFLCRKRYSTGSSMVMML